jgi:hypothetical protein
MMGGSSVEDAIAALTDVLAKDAYCDEALLCRARLYARSARLPKAITDLEAFLVANPTRNDVAEELEHCRRFVPSA